MQHVLASSVPLAFHIHLLCAPPRPQTQRPRPRLLRFLRPGRRRRAATCGAPPTTTTFIHTTLLQFTGRHPFMTCARVYLRNLSAVPLLPPQYTALAFASCTQVVTFPTYPAPSSTHAERPGPRLLRVLGPRRWHPVATRGALPSGGPGGGGQCSTGAGHTRAGQGPAE